MTQPEQSVSGQKIFTEAELNHGLLDMPDMGNSAMVLLGAQAIAEGVTGQPLLNTVVLGATATGLFFSGLVSESKAMERILARSNQPPAETLSCDSAESTSFIDRLRGVGYALIATGAANEVLGVIHGDLRRIMVGIGVASAGIASAMIGAHLRPEQPVLE